MSDVSREARLPAETLRRLESFAALLLRWNKTINMVARADEPILWSRHVLDSAQLSAHIPSDTERAIDLGSGGGFPGLVLAIVTGIPWDLVESDQRKAAFLREAVRATGAPARIHAVRAEHAGLPRAPLLTARGFAPLAQLLPIAALLLEPDGMCVLLKGRDVESEVAAARRGWNMTIDRTPSATDPEASILIISEVHRVGRGG